MEVILMEPQLNVDWKNIFLGNASKDSMKAYPVLSFIVFIFTYLALIAGGIGLLGALKSLLNGEFLSFLGLTLASALIWALIKLTAETIQIIVNIADNTRRSAEYLKQIADKE